MSELLQGCFSCRRIRQPDGSYVKVEPEPKNVSHGICPDCKPVWQEKARRAAASMRKPAPQTESKAAKVVVLMLEDEAPAPGLVPICAWCKRIRQPDGSWVQAPASHNNLTHGICPQCMEKMRADATAAQHGKRQF